MSLISKEEFEIKYRLYSQESFWSHGYVWWNRNNGEIWAVQIDNRTKKDYNIHKLCNKGFGA